MMTQRLKPFSVLLLVLVLTTLSAAYPAPAIPTSPHSMPDEFVRAVLSASAHPFAATSDGYSTHSGGLEVSFSADGLQAQLDDAAWSLSLGGWGRGEAVVPVPPAEIAETVSRLEYLRGALTEWYVDTALGIEHGFSLVQAPAGAGPLILQFDLTTDLAGRLDGDGRGLSFTAPDGRTLRYDHLRAWDANNAMLEAYLLYAPGQIRMKIDDRGATFPITIDPLIYRETKLLASGSAGDNFGYSVALAGDTALVGAFLEDVGANANQGAAYVFTRSGITWILQQKLVALDGAGDDRFGASVALSGDTALVGAPQNAVSGNYAQGSAYVFTRSGTTWSQQDKLTSPDGSVADYFGNSVALSSDTALVGAYLDDVDANPDQGSAYVFTRSGTTWTLQQKLVALDGAPYDQFGHSVALSGDTALMGAYWRSDANPQQGSAYIFTRSGGVWSQQAKLTPSDSAKGDYFGYSVALTGNTALVGALGDDIGSIIDQGSAYVFARNGTTWAQQAKLTASDGAAGDAFGYSVAISGGTALVGSHYDDFGTSAEQGSAYVFAQSGTNWIQRAKLVASDGAGSDTFGHAVAVSTNTALVGAPYHDVGPNSGQGAVYIYAPSGTTWMQQAELSGSAGAQADHFGFAVTIAGDTALVGVPDDDVNANVDQGSVYVFTRSGTVWTFQQKLVASDAAPSDAFGYSVALSDNTALVGAPNHDIGANTVQGAAYVFVRNGSAWSQQAEVIAADGVLGDQFGYSVALSGDTALVGALLADIGSRADQGAAYFFTRSGALWTQQQKLTATDGASADRFGGSVALSSGTALVGAFFDTLGANGMQGSAYVFIWNGAMWAPQQKLTASDGAPSDVFGYSVAISGDSALVGAPGHAAGTNASQGSAYVFTRSGTTWTQQAHLTVADGAAFDNFGHQVTLSGDMALIGAPSDDVGANANQGSAYVFTRKGGVWTQQVKLVASDGAASDQFGDSVALSGNTALVGVSWDDIGLNVDQGSAYFYDLLYGIHLPLLRRGAP